MIAGLPKSGRGLAVACAFVFLACSLAAAQVVDPPVVEEQTPSVVLQPLIDAVALNVAATDTQKADLVAALSTAIASQQLTLDQALSMLALTSWATLSDEESTGVALAAITAVLAGLADGSLSGDPLVLLADALAATLTPEGVLNAIAHAGASDALLEQVGDLILAGIPPGIVVRVAKQSLHDGLAEADLSTLLATLAAEADGDAWGRLVNDVTANPADRYLDRERDENKNSGKNEAPEEEEEENQHGNGGGGKKP